MDKYSSEKHMKRYCSFYLLLFSLLVAIPSTAQTNIALGKTATASTNENATYTPEKAFDGLMTTRWASVYKEGQWIAVDLGSVQPIANMILTWEKAYAVQYDIQVSIDNINWTTVHSNLAGDGGTDIITLSTAARYVRIICLKRVSTHGFSLWEVEIYSTSIVTSSAASSSSAKSSLSSSSSSKSSSGSSSSLAKVITKMEVTWNRPTQRENGQILTLEEIGGYELYGYNSTGKRVYEKVITNNEAVSYIDTLAASMDVRTLKIMVYDTNGLYSRLVDVVPVNSNKPAKAVNLRVIKN